MNAPPIRAVVVTDAHMDRAYEQLRKAGWPTLAELKQFAGQYGCVLGRARGIAEGRVMPPEPTAAAPPSPAPPPPTVKQERRRDYEPRAPRFSTRAAAAGDYLPQEETP